MGLDPTPEELRAWMQAATELVARIYEELPSSRASTSEGAEAFARRVAADRPEPASFEELLDVLREGAGYGFNQLHPGFFAYIPVQGLPIGAVADFLSSALDRYIGLWWPSPGFVQLEWDALRWIGSALGYPPEARGVFTSGGSFASFTALVTARHAILGSNHAQGRVYLTDQTHHSIERALRLMGLDPALTTVIPTNDNLEMDADALERQIARDRAAAGAGPFLVVANAGSINTGAIDPLDRIVEVAHANGLWVHVDGAYGGMFAITDHGRQALRGLADADSITVDPHKGMFLPMGIGAALVRDGQRLRAAHVADAAYLHDMHEEGETPSFGDYSLELTRPFRGLRVWMALRLYGWQPFIEALDRCRRLALRLDNELRADERFELPWRPALSTVVFRLRGGTTAANEALLRRMNDPGRVLLSSTSVTKPGEAAPSTWIRACILSHRSGDEDVDHALEDIRTAAEEVLATA